MARRSSYEQIWDGEWNDATEPFDLACCECHFVHGIHVRVRKGRVQIKFIADRRATSQLRRHHGGVRGKRANVH